MKLNRKITAGLSAAGAAAIFFAWLAHAVIAGTLAGFDVSPIYVAHELYHFLDSARAVPLARRHRVKILGLWTSGLTSLPEIAAGAFAQALLGLPWHPKWLELQFAVRSLGAGDSEEVAR